VGLTVEQLKRELLKFPSSAEVMIDVAGKEAEATDVDWVVDENQEVTALIHDYHPHNYRK